MRIISGLLVLITVATLAQTPAAPAPTSTETCTTEDYAIYSAALNELFGKQSQKLVLIDQTSTGVPPGMAGWTRSMRKAQPLLTEFPKEAREDFDARNKTHAKIEPNKIMTSFETTLIALDKATGGVTVVSRPGLDSDRTHALLYTGTSCGPRCGVGCLIFLTQENGQWKVSNKADIWMS
jgi:hypothetical protein